MLRIPLSTLFLLSLLGPARPAFASGAWRGTTLPLPQEPGVKLLGTRQGLLALHARHLSVIDGAGQVRRAYALNSQTDGFADVSADEAGWYLASRRSVLSSSDGGYTWRALDSITPRDPNEWLALHALPALLLGASGYGIKRIEPGLSTAWGPKGHDAILRAVSNDRVLAFEADDGVFAVTDATGIRTFSLPLPYGLGAAWTDGQRFWFAGGRGLVQCGDRCGMSTGPKDIGSLAAFSGEMWAAAPDGVWHANPEDGAWVNESAGLGAGMPISLTVWNGALWVLTETGLYQWEDNPAGPARARHPLLHPRRGPAMEQVRAMVLAAQSLRPGDAESWRKRARWRGAAPALGFTVRQGVDEKSGRTLGNTVGLSTTDARIVIGPDGRSTTRTSGRAVDYGVALTWNLDDLVFNTQELSVNSEAEEEFKLRKTILLDVTRLYYDRLRVLAEQERATDEAKRIELEIRFDELTADLDFYTGGRFSLALSQAPPEKGRP